MIQRTIYRFLIAHAPLCARLDRHHGPAVPLMIGDPERDIDVGLAYLAAVARCAEGADGCHHGMTRAARRKTAQRIMQEHRLGDAGGPEVGDRVCGGEPGTDEYDEGVVTDIDSDGPTVAWDSGTCTGPDEGLELSDLREVS